MQAGRLVAAYVEDAMGRRLVIGAAAKVTPSSSTSYVDQPITFAETQAEAKEAIRVLRELAQELPP